MVPSYRFFAPRPRMRYARVWTTSDSGTKESRAAEWQPFSFTQERGLHLALWNPSRKAAVAFDRRCLSICDAVLSQYPSKRVEAAVEFVRVVDVVRGRVGPRRPFRLRVVAVEVQADGTEVVLSEVRSGFQRAL